MAIRNKCNITCFRLSFRLNLLSVSFMILGFPCHFIADHAININTVYSAKTVFIVIGVTIILVGIEKMIMFNKTTDL